MIHKCPCGERTSPVRYCKDCEECMSGNHPTIGYNRHYSTFVEKKYETDQQQSIFDNPNDNDNYKDSDTLGYG